MKPGSYTVRAFGRGPYDARLARTIYGTSYTDAAGFVYVEAHIVPPRFALLRKLLTKALDNVKRKP